MNPGSSEARAAGCLCAVMDNAHGAGAFFDEHGKPAFWINMECPLHGDAAARELKREGK
jgi:hypothetical protein